MSRRIVYALPYILDDTLDEAGIRTVAQSVVNQHSATTDPHPQYLLESQQAAAIAAHVALADPHPQYLLESGVSAYGATLIDDADAATARTTLGLGTAAVLNVGTSAHNIVQLDGAAKLPAVNGSQLTNLPVSPPGGSNTQVQFNDSGAFGGDSGLVYNRTTNVLTSGPLYIDGTGESTILGYQAGFRDDYGNRQNTVVGFQSAYNTTSGSTNIAIGRQSLYTNTTGSSNSALGTQSMYYNVNGSGNTGLGFRALFNNTNGGSNAAFGEVALFNNASGSRNTAFGASAGYLSTGSDNLYLGNSAGYNETGNNKLYVANSNTTKPLIYGEFDTAILKFHSTINSDTVTNTLSLIKRRSSGTPGTGLGTALRAGLHSSTTEDQDAGRLRWEWVTATHASRASRGKLTAYYITTEQEAMTWDGDTGGLKLAFYGGTPVAKAAAYTQTYSTADRTLSAYTADNESSAYTGIDNLQIGSVYAQLTDLNNLRVAYENLRAFVEDLAQHHNSLLDDMQALGLVG